MLRAQSVELSTVALRGPPRTAFPTEHWSLRSWRRRRAVVDEALDGHGSSDPFVQHLHHLDDALTGGDATLDAVACLDLRGGFRRSAVHRHPAGAEELGGGRPCGGEAHRPHPGVEACSVDDVMVAPRGGAARTCVHRGREGSRPDRPTPVGYAHGSAGVWTYLQATRRSGDNVEDDCSGLAIETG